MTDGLAHNQPDVGLSPTPVTKIMYAEDLKIVKDSGYRIMSSFWKLEGCRYYLLEEVAMRVCDNPEKEPGHVVDWAIDFLLYEGRNISVLQA